jgi:ATP-dependent Clp protease ATP-binding subunit ClpC
MTAPPAYISPEAWKVIQTAKTLALRDGAGALLPHHLFEACVVEERDLVSNTLAPLCPADRSVERLLAALGTSGSEPAPPESSSTKLQVSPEAGQILARARELAERDTPGESPSVAPAHLFATVCAGAAALEGRLRQCGWPDDLIARLPEVSRRWVNAPPAGGLSTAEADILDRFCSRHLTRLARAGRLQAAHGTESVRWQIVNVLLKKNKRSVVLTGPAGVGKTKLVEDLSVAIARGQVPDLAGCSVYELDLVQFTRGTHLVGSQAERWAQLTGVLKAHSQDLILFIDELHTIVGLSMGGPAMDLANALKPLMVDDTLRLIGATTVEEYRRYIEGDPALARRFTEVRIPEPDREGTLAILRGVAPTYEAHHQVRYDEEALREIYDLASLYSPSQSFPAKGVDLMDEVGARVRVDRGAAPAEGGRLPVTRADVRETIRRVRGVEPQEPAVDLAGLLKERVVGQDHAADRLADMIIVSRFRPETELHGRPRASILFVGPPGVGKSYMARALSDALFPGRGSLLTVDMTEFGGPHAGEHTRFRLLGPPPPYAGWENGGLLTSHALLHPQAVVLVDELDKAAGEGRSIFLRILNDGSVQDGRGRIVSFKGMYFIFTANAGRRLWESLRRPLVGYRAMQAPPQAGGRQVSDEEIREELRREGFAPEFLSRMSQVVLFRELTHLDLEAVAASELRRLGDHVLTTGAILLEYDEAALCRWLVARTPQPRDCRRVQATVEREVETPLAHWRIARPDRDPVILRIEPLDDRVQLMAEREAASVAARLLSRVHEVFGRQQARLRQQRAAQAQFGTGV